MYNSGQFQQHWKYDLCFACLRPASFLFSQFSTAKFSTFPFSTLTCCFLRKRFQLCPTRRVHFWFPFISLSLFPLLSSCDGGLRDVNGLCAGSLLFAQTIHKTSWCFFQQRKKNLGAVFLFRFLLKICCSYAGHTLSISLFLHNPRSTPLFLPSPNRRRGDIGWLDSDDGNGGDGGGGDHVVGDGDDDGEDDGDWGACHDGGASSLFVLCLAVLCAV